MKKRKIFAKIFSILLILAVVFSSAAIAFAGGDDGPSEEEKRRQEQEAAEAREKQRQNDLDGANKYKSKMLDEAEKLIKEKKDVEAKAEAEAKAAAEKAAKEKKEAEEKKRQLILEEQQRQMEENRKALEEKNNGGQQDQNNQNNSQPLIPDEENTQGEDKTNEGDITFENENGETIVITAEEFNNLSEEEQAEVRHEAAKSKINNNEGYSQDEDEAFEENKALSEATDTDENVERISPYYTQEYNGSGNNLYSAIVDPIVSIINTFFYPLIDIVTAVGGLYVIVLGVKLARAEDPQERQKAKTNIKNFLIGYVLIFILFVTMNLIKDPLINWIASTVGKY